jgi:hypothetical protein
MQSRRLLPRRNELSRSLRCRQRRTKNELKPVRNCENSSKRFERPPRSFFYGGFKENLFKRQKETTGWPGQVPKRTHQARLASERPRGGWTKRGVLRGGFGPLSINVLGLDFQSPVINWTWIRSPFSQYDRPAPPEDHAECARQRRSAETRGCPKPPGASKAGRRSRLKQVEVQGLDGAEACRRLIS